MRGSGCIYVCTSVYIHIYSTSPGNIAVTITKVPEMITLPISSFNAEFGQEAEEREYTNLGIGQRMR